MRHVIGADHVLLKFATRADRRRRRWLWSRSRAEQSRAHISRSHRPASQPPWPCSPYCTVWLPTGTNRATLLHSHVFAESPGSGSMERAARSLPFCACDDAGNSGRRATCKGITLPTPRRIQRSPESCSPARETPPKHPKHPKHPSTQEAPGGACLFFATGDWHH